MRLGIHAPVRHGYLKALQDAEAHGCKVLQIFCYRRHHEPTDAELDEFRVSAQKSKVRVLVHARYLPYLSFDEGRKRAATIALLERELRLSSALGAEGLIVHFGAYSVGGTQAQGLKLFSEALTKAWDRSPRRVPIWVENVPGGGRRLGGPLEECRSILGTSPATGVVLDTAHAYAAGYDIAGDPKGFVEKVRGVLGDSVVALHLNDTNAPLASNRENHANWGEGVLGAALPALAKAFAGLPAIVEAPPGGEAVSLAYVRKALRVPR